MFLCIQRRSEIPAVSVIIPAYNAGRWIKRTLDSARQQTFTDIEIIAVDDGSTDNTVALIEAASQQDSRVRLIRQPHGGVARARNAGIAAAAGPVTAMLDADDLWHPTRLQQHVAALSAAPAETGLAYSLHFLIDEDDGVIAPGPFMAPQGDVFEQHLLENFVGNGSGITVRTELLRRVGGYSSALRDQGAQGAEDWLLQLKLAYLCRFVMVPGYLIGYRVTAQNMSSDLLQMKRSIVYSLSELETFATEIPRTTFLWPRARAYGRLAHEYARKGLWPDAGQTFAAEAGRNPLLVPYLAILLGKRTQKAVRSRFEAAWSRLVPGAPQARIPFYQADPHCRRRIPAPASVRLLTPLYRRLGERRLRRTRSNTTSKRDKSEISRGAR